MAPDGVFYVVKGFSVTLDDGIHGFPPGKEVKLVKEEGNLLYVSDGRIEGNAPKESFTNNLDVLDGLIANLDTQRVSYSQPTTAYAPEERANPTEDARQSAFERQRKVELSRLITERNSLNDRIGKVREEISLKGDPKKRRDGFGFGRSPGGKIITWSADASNFDRLVETRDNLNNQIGRLEGN